MTVIIVDAEFGAQHLHIKVVGVDNKGAFGIVHHLEITFTFNRNIACVPPKNGGIGQLGARIGNHTAAIGQGYVQRVVASYDNLPHHWQLFGHLLHGLLRTLHPHNAAPQGAKQQRNHHCSHAQKMPFAQMTTLNRHLGIGLLHDVCHIYRLGFAAQHKVF